MRQGGGEWTPKQYSVSSNNDDQEDEDVHNEIDDNHDIDNEIYSNNNNHFNDEQ